MIGADFEGATLAADAFDGSSPPDSTSPVSETSIDVPFDAQAGELLFWVASDRGVVDGGPLDGGTDGAVLVPKWQDQSGRGRDLTQTFIAKQPLLVPAVQNGLPAMRFDRARSTCYASAWLGPSRLEGTTAFVVARGSPSSLLRFQGPNPDYFIFPWNARYYDLDASPDFFFIVSAGSDSNKVRVPFDEREWTLAVARLEVGKIAGMQVFKNGALLESVSIFADGGPSPDGFQVGCAPGQLGEFSNADVAEIMIYGTALTDPDRVAVEAYLKAKWALAF